jgi:hypothetical protein
VNRATLPVSRDPPATAGRRRRATGHGLVPSDTENGFGSGYGDGYGSYFLLRSAFCRAFSSAFCRSSYWRSISAA